MPKVKVLIIDDEVDYCMIMKSYLEKRNYEVVLAFTLHQGIDKLQETKPDILLLDNNLPDGSGWQHLEEFVEKFPQMRVYLISAYHQKKDFISPSPKIIVWEKPISLNLLNEHF
jgi:DNA-binding response OmpR family regulator